MSDIRPSITDVVGIQDFAVLYKWKIVFSKVPAGLDKYLGGLLNLYALSSEYPKFSEEEIETTMHGKKVYQAGMRTYDPITITFIENNSAIIQKFIKAWAALINTPNEEGQKAKKDYVCQIQLSPLKADGGNLASYNLVNCWMQTHTIGNPDGSANETIKPEITLRFDYFD